MVTVTVPQNISYARPRCSKLSRSLPIATMKLIANPMESGRWLPTRNPQDLSTTQCFPAPPRHEAVRRASPIPKKLPAAFPPHDPPARIASDRAPGGDHHLRNGATRRVSPALQADTALRGLGSGRSRSLDRSQKTGFTSSQGRGSCRPGCQAASIQARTVNDPPQTADTCKFNYWRIKAIWKAPICEKPVTVYRNSKMTTQSDPSA